MRPLGVSDGDESGRLRAGPLEKKIDNFLLDRLRSSIVFQKARLALSRERRTTGRRR